MQTFHPDDIYPCKIGLCRAKYFSETELENHVLDRHKMVQDSNNDQVQNQEPATKVANPNLALHQTGSGMRYFKEAPSLELFCKECNIAFSIRRQIVKHMQTFHPDKVLYPCKIGLCKAKFSSEEDHRKHVLDRHKIVLGENGESNIFQCAICQAQFNTANQFNYHKGVYHKKEDKKKLESEKEIYNCEFCGKTFLKRFNFKLHIKKVHENDPSEIYTCTHCNKKFGYKWSMLNHVKNEHENSKQHICEICGMAFNYSQALKKHKLQIHEKNRSDPCEFCNKTFASNNRLKLHIKVVHEKSVIYSCKICAKTFTNGSQQKRHLRDVHKITDEEEIEENRLVVKS